MESSRPNVVAAGFGVPVAALIAIILDQMGFAAAIPFVVGAALLATSAVSVLVLGQERRPSSLERASAFASIAGQLAMIAYYFLAYPPAH